MISRSSSAVSKPDLNTTIDGFLDNSFFVSQSAKGPHRAGLDAVLLAATVPEDAKGRVADFGAGCGVAGMAVAQRCKGVTVDLVEINAGALEHARRSVGLVQNAHLADRLKVIDADLTAKGEDRISAGLLENTYDHIIANPPYNDDAFQPSPDPDRAFAHAMEPNMLEKWVKTAAHVARAKANLTLILRPASMGDLLGALGSRFGSVKIKPIHATERLPALLMLVQAVKGGRAPLEIQMPLVLRGMDGNMRAEVEEIMRGRAESDFGG